MKKFKQEILDEIKVSLMDVSPLNLKSAEVRRDVENIECPLCEEGYLEATDYTNIDDLPLGVQFFGIGYSIDKSERYFTAVSPKNIRKLLVYLEDVESVFKKLEEALSIDPDLDVENMDFPVVFGELGDAYQKLVERHGSDVG
jgi:hypothetical protein